MSSNRRIPIPRRFPWAMKPWRTPLAWKNLVHDWRRLLLSSSGVGFAAVLIFTQNGFRYALLDSPVQLLDAVDASLVAISPARYSIPIDQRFDRDLLRRAQGDPDVVAVRALCVERLLARVRVAGHRSRPIRVIAVPAQAVTSPSDADGGSAKAEAPWLQISGLAEQRHKLRVPATALVDLKSRREYHFQFDDDDQPVEQVVELADRRIQLVGSVTIGTDFATEGTLVVSEETFAELFSVRNSGEPLESVDFGLIRLRPGADADVVAARLQRDPAATGRWEVMTPTRLKTREAEFWSSQTPVGIIFSFGVLMGFAVGVIICYQILFTSLQEAMPEFATLKAMGYPNRFFVRLVIQQSLYLSLFGFVPAVLVCLGLFRLIESASGLPMHLTWDRAAQVLGLTSVMCLVSGLLAMRKLLSADLASLF